MNVLLLVLFLNSAVFTLSAELQQCSDYGVQVTVTSLDSGVRELQWVGGQSVAFVVTWMGSLYRTKDGGNTWELQNDKLEHFNEWRAEHHGSVGGVESVYATADPDSLIILSHDSIVWLTDDRGESYRVYDFGQVVHGVKPHAAEAHETNSAVDTAVAQQVLIATVSDRCFNRTAPGVCQTSVWYTDDLLASKPKLVSDDAAQYEWGPDNLLYLTKFVDDGQALHSWQRGAYATTLWSCKYDLTNWQPVSSHVAGFLFAGENLFVATQPNRTESQLNLYVKTKDNPILFRLSFEAGLSEARYTILHADVSSLWINVQHDSADMGNIYVLSSTSTETSEMFFSLSLERAARSQTGSAQFVKFHGLDGVYLSNVYLDNGLEYDWMVEDLMTVITYDNGGAWHSLKAPTTDPTGNTPKCLGADCHLHLHGVRKPRLHRDSYLRQEFGPLHTKRNTVGLALASGNIGRALSFSDVGVFFSRDGGISWDAIATGSHTYDFADHGGILMLANNDWSTDFVSFSVDEGLTFSSCLLGDDLTLVVEDVVSDPDAIGEDFLLHGQANDTFVIAHVDFTKLKGFDRECVADDYEQWSFVGAAGLPCHLGTSTTYKRRKRDHKCRNTIVLEQSTIKGNEACPCSREDYECDRCFAPQVTRGFQTEHCIPTACDKEEEELYPAEFGCEGSYEISRGYRLVPETKCDKESGIELYAEVLPCPTPKDVSGMNGGVVALLVLLILVVAGVVGGLLFVWMRRRQAPPSLDYGTLATPDSDDDDSDHGYMDHGSSVAATAESSSSSSDNNEASGDEFNPRQ